MLHKTHMKKPQFVNNQIYHVYNRGVDKREIFLNTKDYFRFIHDLFEFNDQDYADNLNYRFALTLKNQSMGVELPYIIQKKPRKLLVEILEFCLMPNHYHLLLKQECDNGITKFMQKLGTGYTNYFNQKYERTGSLFQGRFKAILIENDSHFLHIPYYIHLNPLDLKFPHWRNRKIRNYKKVMGFLENYRWSSLKDYVGKKNFPSVTQREFLLKCFGGHDEYKKEILNWLKDIDIEAMNNIITEVELP